MSQEPSHGSASKILAGLNQQVVVHPIEKIQQFYAQNKNQIADSIIGSEKDPTEIATQFARLACEQTRMLLPVGRGNVYEDIIKSKGDSHMKADMIRDILMHSFRKDECIVKNGVVGAYNNLVRQNMQSEGNVNGAVTALTGLMVRSHLALRYQSGNCNECSAVAVQCLFEMKRKLGDDFDRVVKGIRMVSAAKPLDHIFVELDVRDSNNDVKTVICDPWAGYVGKIENVPNGLFVLGQPARQVYQSQNKQIIHDEALLNFAYKYNSSFGESPTCLQLYAQAMLNNHQHNYCKYLRELPDVLSLDYQNKNDYPRLLRMAQAHDYEEDRTLTFQALNAKFDEQSAVPPSIQTIHQKTYSTLTYYSQPDHPHVNLHPIDKSSRRYEDFDEATPMAKVEVREMKQPKEIPPEKSEKPKDNENNSASNDSNVPNVQSPTAST